MTSQVKASTQRNVFLLGIYGVLTTTDKTETRDTMLAKLVDTAVRGLGREV